MAENRLEKEALDRLDGCKRHKANRELDFRECYFFAAPHRARTVNSNTAINTSPPVDADQLNTSIAFELVQDFATVVTDTFLPPNAPWAERRPGIYVPDAVKADVQQKVRDADAKVFECIRGSNFYAEIQKSFNVDLAIGTFAIWIDKPRQGDAIGVQAIPLRELEINIGPFGSIDDRFVVRHTKLKHVKAVLGKIDLPSAINSRIADKPEDKVQVRWGFWRLWDELNDEVWQHVILIDNDLVHNSELRGVGSCPLVVGRWNPSPDFPHGEGPLIQCLPDLRHLDELSMAKIENIDMHLRPPVTLPDDSFVNFENGIVAGKGYPVRPGTEGAVKQIYDPPPANPAIYEQQDREQRCKRIFFLDWPQQRGDTPPTAEQWRDQMIMAQRRIGNPGLAFWSELCAPAFLRFLYMLQKDGVIEPVKVNGKTVSLMPQNPAQKAAEQQDVQNAVQFVSVSGQAFPEEYKAWVDGQKTMVNFRQYLGADKIIVFRKPEEVAKAAALIHGLSGGTPPAGAPAPEANGVGPPADLGGPAPQAPRFVFRMPGSQ